MSENSDIPNSVAQERANPLISIRIDEEGQKFARAFLAGLDGIEDSGAWPSFEAIHDVLQSINNFVIIRSVIYKYLIDLFDSLLRNDKEPLKRKYRKRAELPDPTQPANAEVNRAKAQLKLRVDPAVVEAIDAAAAQAGMTRSDWVTEAALQKLELEEARATDEPSVRRKPDPE